MQPTKKLAAFEAFSLYLLTGAACIVLGSSMTQLTRHLGVGIAAVAALGSAFGLGRVLTVFLMGHLTERFGAKRILAAGALLLFCFLTVMPLTCSYPLALAVSLLGGIGMGTQDTTCPVILSGVYPQRYASAMSAGQAFFGAGCFLPPLLMSIVLRLELPFGVTYYAFAALALVMLALLPAVRLPEQGALPPEERLPALRLRSRALGYALFSVICVCYCAIINTVNLYTASVAQQMGVPAAGAVLLLTVYNVGSMAGSLLFIGILRRARPATVLWCNTLAALCCVALAVRLRSAAVFFVALFFAGAFLGVLFSILITLSTGMNPDHAGLAGALVAVLGGGSDTVTPLITGRLVTAFGPGAAYAYVLLMLALTLAGAVGFRALCVFERPQAQQNKKES